MTQSTRCEQCEYEAALMAYRAGLGASEWEAFIHHGTTALVARRHGRKSIGIELNAEYAKLAATRLQQLSLLAEPA